MEMHRTNIPNNKQKNNPDNKTHRNTIPRKTYKFKNRHKMPMVWRNLKRLKLNTETPKNTNTTTHMAYRNMPHQARKKKHKRNMGRNTQIQQEYAK